MPFFKEKVERDQFIFPTTSNSFDNLFLRNIFLISYQKTTIPNIAEVWIILDLIEGQN